MSGSRYERLLATTALALIIAAPIAASAQDAGAPATATSEAAAQAGAAALSRREAAAVSAPAPAETAEPAPAPKDAVAPAPAASPSVASEPLAAPATDPLATLDLSTQLLAAESDLVSEDITPDTRELTSEVPVRFGVPPEISILTLRSER